MRGLVRILVYANGAFLGEALSLSSKHHHGWTDYEINLIVSAANLDRFKSGTYWLTLMCQYRRSPRESWQSNGMLNSEGHLAQFRLLEHEPLTFSGCFKCSAPHGWNE